MGNQISLAFIGAGAMASAHARAFGSLGDVRLAGICSRTRERAEILARETGIENVYDDVDSLWSGARADAVVIAVKEPAAQAVIESAAAYPWMLFLEKPAGYNYELAGSIRQLIHEKGRRAFVALNRRYYDATQRALALLSEHSGERFIEVYDQQSFEYSRSMGHPEEVVEAMMYANSVHLVDYLRLFGRGQIERVERDTEWRGEKSFVHSARIYFDSGDWGRYTALWKGPGPWACTVTTSEQRVEMRPLETLMVQTAGSRELDTVAIDEVDRKFKAGFVRQAADVVNAVRGRATSLATIDDAYETSQLIYDIYGA